MSTKKIIFGVIMTALALSAAGLIYKTWKKKKDAAVDPCGGMGVWNPATQQCEAPVE